jgi:hypothetical protein
MPELDADYDESTIARLERGGRAQYHVPPPGSPSARAGWRRSAATGGLLTGLALGLREVFDPPPDEEVILEVDIDAPPGPPAPVRFVMVDGAPAASRIILRPWLAT